MGQVVSRDGDRCKGNTSEFAQDVTVSANAPLDIGYQITGPTYNPIKHTYTETVKLTNDGTTTVHGFEFVLEGLTPGVTLTNASGTTSDGSPYVTVGPAVAGPVDHGDVDLHQDLAVTVHQLHPQVRLATAILRARAGGAARQWTH